MPILKNTTWLMACALLVLWMEDDFTSALDLGRMGWVDFLFLGIYSLLFFALAKGCQALVRLLQRSLAPRS